MLVVNYTDKTGTYTMYGRGILPDPSIVNKLWHVCDYCNETIVDEADTNCMPCCIKISDKVGRTEHVESCQW